MIYLKTYFYSSHEIPFIILNLMEAYEHIDKFIICEYDYTHTGIERKYIFDNHKKQIPEKLIDKVKYLKISGKGVMKYAYNDEPLIHKINEPFMRGAFVKYINLNDDDIVISVDADEIIYGESYPKLIKEMKNNNILQLQLNQFYYRVNYHWKNIIFKGPVIAKYKVYKNKYPSQWRYQGKIYADIVGTHFSWCMTIDEMLHKMDCYSHPQYRYLKNREILEDAVKNKKYPFNKKIKFDIEIIDIDKSQLIPNKMKQNKKMFENLIWTP